MKPDTVVPVVHAQMQVVTRLHALHAEHLAGQDAAARKIAHAQADMAKLGYMLALDIPNRQLTFYFGLY